MKKTVIFAVDFAIAVLIVASIWCIQYLLPQKGISAHSVLAYSGENKKIDKIQEISSKEQKIQNLIETSNNGMQATKVSLNNQD